MKAVGIYSAKPKPTKKAEDLAPLPTEKRMSDSFVQLDLKFSEDEELREAYVGGYAQVRMGRLMEGTANLRFQYVIVG
jgi:acyl-coenzyme A thioesterase 9